ncbi:MAG: methylaspartate mutase subunit E [Chloroflexi bacterium]|nr:methylaspartate mutase subunit E [Chloroflexota bacterium]
MPNERIRFVELKNRRWDEKDFRRVFAEVQALHHTGSEVSLEGMLECQAALPPEKRTAAVYEAAKRDGRVLVQPRAGVATIEGMIQLLKHLRQVGGADILPMTPDTYTRRLQFESARKGLDESVRTGRSMLNGFPVVEHGIRGCRQVVEAFDVPLSVRCTSSTARLPITVALASGVTETVAGAINSAMGVDQAPFEAAIQDWQYTGRLVGWLEEHGIPITLEYDSTGFASVVAPPALGIIINVVDVLLAAEQGVKHHCPTYVLNNCLVQDLAGTRMMRELCRRYLDRFGFRDSVIYPSANQWHGAYPNNVSEAFAIISLSTFIAFQSKAVKIMVRSVEEGVGAPTAEWNAGSIKATRRMVEMLRNQELPPNKEVDDEAKRIDIEVTNIMDRILEVGKGDVAVGVVGAIQGGLFDVPFSPNPANAGKVLGVKDSLGASRYLDTGNLPLPRDIVEFHRDRVRQRIDAEGWEDEYEMLAYDIRGGRKW